MGVAERRTRLRVAMGAVLLLLLLAGLAALAYPHARRLWHHHRLVALLESPDATRRLRAATALAAMGDARAAPALVGTLESRVDTQSRFAVAALCDHGGPDAVRLLDAALHRPDVDRALMLATLACVDHPEARAALGRILRDADGVELETTVMLLSGSPDPRIVTLLANAVSRADRHRRLTILGSLSDAAGRPLAGPLVTLLRAAANGEDDALRRVARHTLRWNALNRPGSTGRWGRDDPPDLAPAATDRILSAAARRAAALLAAGQDPAGFWQTSRSYSPDPSKAAFEMNTYLTPLIVDMLDPVATAAGLGETIALARKQIRGQVEPNGLVRYYGSAAMAAGRNRICGISPDADDTALAWRVAPPSDAAMLHEALSTLTHYRAGNGLYRTWLSSTDGAHCIDRGKDPNPTDVGIQMHILLFLAGVQPPAGRALCAALGRSIDDDRIWVYYEREPLVPMIRQTDLARVGCRVRIPEARIRADLAGQGKWLAAGRALLPLLHRDFGAADRDATVRLLLRLAQGDFAAVHQAPPLLYQNDSTGKAPAFYWSREFGYALWLRLYFETLRRG